MPYLDLLPDGYSFSTTSLLLLIKSRQSFVYQPLTIKARQGGKSSLHLKDGWNTLLLIVRLVMLFAPLRVFLPLAGLLLLLAVGVEIGEILTNGFNVSDTVVLLSVSAVIVFLFGLLADQLAALRREIHRRNNFPDKD